VLCAVGASRRPAAELLAAVSTATKLSRARVKAAVRDLVAAGEIAYVSEHGRIVVEPSFDRPVRVSERIILAPPGREAAASAGDAVVWIAAGAAFGAGRHPTTRLALRGIEAALAAAGRQPGARVLDIGTGTGVLAIAAVKLGIEAGQGIDIDPCAVAEAAENIRLNGMEDRVTVSDIPLEGLAPAFALITANLRPPTLARLAASLASLAEPAGAVVVSGMRSEELDGILRVYEKAGFRCRWTSAEDHWAGAVLVKKGAAGR
jgi:ribosomal protein L11 methyltransferase